MRLPGAEIRLFRQFALRAQPVEHGGIGRVLFEEGGIELEQAAIGGVVEQHPLVRPENRDRGRKLVERAPMRADDAAQLRAHRFGLGHVDADAGGALGIAHLDHVDDAPRARDHRRQSFAEDTAGGADAQRFLARRLIEEFHLERLRGIRGLDRRRIGAVGEGELA